MRKVFDQDTGKHVAQPASTADIFAPPVDALTVKCWACNAKPGERCGSVIDASKYLDVPHAQRIKDAARAANADPMAVKP